MYEYFFFNDTATTEIYTLSLHDALPILHDTYGFPIDVTLEMAAEQGVTVDEDGFRALMKEQRDRARADSDRKSTRLNSSHANISYAVFCLKKKIRTNPMY